MLQRKLQDVGEPPSCSQCERSHLILSHAHETAAALLAAFRKVKSPRAGATTDEEQDLLRAMLVFACAGLDSMLKQLIRDTLPDISAWDEIARGELLKFVERSCGAVRMMPPVDSWILGFLQA